MENRIKIHHIGIVVENLEGALRFFRDILGLKVISREILEERGLEVVYLDGGVRIELITPIREGTAVQKFLEKRGGGLHHISFLVKDMKDFIEKFKSFNIRIVDGPREGSGGHTVLFLDPRDAHRVLIELMEEEN